MARKVEISDVVRMIRECAPRATLRVANHSIMVRHGNVSMHIPRGEDTPKKNRVEDAKGEMPARVVQKLAARLGIPAACVNNYFPGLMDAKEAASSKTTGHR